MNFGMRTLLVVMLIASVLSLATGYLFQWHRSGSRGFLLAFFLVVMAGPMLLMVALSVASRLGRREDE
jgi:ABC-type glycerol-3-phosphate transport system permease component